MYFREYVEYIIINRLIKQKPTDVLVPDEDYFKLCDMLNTTIKRLSRERKIMGFTQEDLESFMYLKIYQVLQRGQYNFKNSPYRYFLFIFRNLFNDINRIKNRAISNGLGRDALDDCVTYLDEVKVNWRTR